MRWRSCKPTSTHLTPSRPRVDISAMGRSREFDKLVALLQQLRVRSPARFREAVKKILSRKPRVEKKSIK